MTQEHVLAGGADDCAQTKQHEKRHTGMRKGKRKVGSKAKKQEYRAQGVHSNKASRLSYKAKPETLSHYLPSSSYSRRQRYQVSLSRVTTAAVDPPLREQVNDTIQNYPRLGGCS